MENQIRRIFKGLDDAFVLQVGSHDGVSNDPLHALFCDNPAWSGILVEPVPHLFARLCLTYRREPRLICENIAIAAQSGYLPFYFTVEGAHIPPNGTLPHWHDQLGSFRKEHILKHLDGTLAPLIRCLHVECLTLEDLFARHRVERLDLVHIDAEGADYMVLSQLDLRRLTPRVVIYEHEHLSPAERNSASAFLRAHGYSLSSHGFDTLAQRDRF